MNFLEQKRVLIWVIVVLLIFNITAGITIAVHISNEKSVQEQPQETDYLKQELNLNDEQVRGLGRIRTEFRKTSQPLAARIRETRKVLIEEMAQKHPDTLRMKELSAELGTFQGELTYQIASQFVSIQDICSPEQALKLNAAYQYLFGFEDTLTQFGKGYRHRWGARGRGSE